MCETQESRWVRRLWPVLLIGVPLALLLWDRKRLAHGGLAGEMTERQLFNFYATDGVAVAWGVLTVGLIVWCVLRKAELIRPDYGGLIRLAVFALLMVFLGTHVLRMKGLTHAWFQWTFTHRLSQAGRRLAAAWAVGGTCLALWPIWSRDKETKRSDRVVRFAAYLFWAYAVVSCAAAMLNTEIE